MVLSFFCVEETGVRDPEVPRKDPSTVIVKHLGDRDHSPGSSTYSPLVFRAPQEEPYPSYLGTFLPH